MLAVVDQQTDMSRLLDNGATLAERWRIAGRWSDGLTLLGGLLPVATALGDAALARLWLLHGRTLIDHAQFGGVDTVDERTGALDAALHYAEAANDAALLGAAWDARGMSLHAFFLNGDRKQEPPDELASFERGLALRRQGEDQAAIADSLFHVGLVYGVVRGDHTTAMPYFQESYALATAAGDPIVASYAIRHVAFAHHAFGELPSAHAALLESLRLREKAGFVPGVAMALHMLAYAQTELGDRDGARTSLERARAIFQTLGAGAHFALIDETAAELGLEQ